MKRRIILLIGIFLFFVLIFLIEKIVFSLVCSPRDVGVSGENILDILYHGLPLDFSLSGCLTVFPAFLLIASIWVRSDAICRVLNTYFAVVLSIIAVISIADITLYTSSGSHLNYLLFSSLQSLKEALVGVSFVGLSVSLLAMVLISFLLYVAYKSIFQSQILKLRLPFSIATSFVVVTLFSGLLVLPIISWNNSSVAEVEKVSFSDNSFLNHAAVNPIINFISSFTQSNNYGSQYQFYSKAEAAKIFAELNAGAKGNNVKELLNTERPNIIFFILENMSASVASDSVVAPYMDSFAKEGVRFDNFYASGSNSQGGLISIFSGYPTHPTVEVIDHPYKARTLPSISKALKKVDYNLSFYSGAKIDSDNVRSYLTSSCAINEIYTANGVSDKYLFNKVLADLLANKSPEPFMKIVLARSSREPFDVPINKFSDPYKNSVAYTDSCLGSFVDSLQTTEVWDNTLLVLVADRAAQTYPKGLDKMDSQYFQIPMIWIGGALNRGRETISDYGSQNDIAATLLSQMKIEHTDFKFSKDMLAKETDKFAFYSYPNGFSMIADTLSTVTYDNDKKQVLTKKGDPSLEKRAKAFFQNMYIDFGAR